MELEDGKAIAQGDDVVLETLRPIGWEHLKYQI
jgi:hypothetical protein